MASNSEENTIVNSAENFDRSKTPIRGPEAFPLLEIVHGPKQGVWFTVAHQKEMTMGRAVTNHIMLEDNSVSRSHAVLEARQGGFVVRDIGSRNGTFVNDQKIQGEVFLKHLDTIKVGIYVFRYLTEPTESVFEFQEEAATVMETPSEVAEDQQAFTVDPSTEAMTQEADKIYEGETNLQQELAEALGEEKAADLPQAEGGSKRSLKSLFILLSILLVVGSGGYVAYRLGVFDSLKNNKNVSSNGKSSPNKDKDTPQIPDKPVDTKPLKPDTDVTQGELFPIFLEVSSQPLPAKIFYQGKELGTSPFKINLQVPPTKPQELTAEVFLPKIDEKLDVKQSFTVAKQEDLVKLDLKLPLGALRLEALPKEGRLFLEGKFKGETGPTKSLELKEIDYNEPVYLPYGKYVVEIRVPESLAGSTSQVDHVRFRRDFVLAPNNTEFKLNVPDEALKSFPAKITTQPSEASVWLDGKKVGETPFEGPLPLGRHTLLLKKEGFNDFEKEITIELNTPYEVNFNLETSPAGIFVNKARELIRTGKTQEATEQLVEALKRQPEPTELSQIHLLLGEAFLKSKNYDQALAYFQKEAASTEYGSQAKLGMAQALSGQGKKDQALIQVVDVYLKTTDAKLKSQAESTFKIISPMKSVLYVTSEPGGAAVTVNGNAIGQVTPVILSDLMVGSYRVGVTKEGFKPFESRVTLSVSVIQPVIVKLEENKP